MGLFFAMNQKPYKTISELIQMMIDRGLNVDNKQQLEVFCLWLVIIISVAIFVVFRLGQILKISSPIRIQTI